MMIAMILFNVAIDKFCYRKTLLTVEGWKERNVQTLLWRVRPREIINIIYLVLGEIFFIMI